MSREMSFAMNCASTAWLPCEGHKSIVCRIAVNRSTRSGGMTTYPKRSEGNNTLLKVPT
jgi:hypothetical protein